MMALEIRRLFVTVLHYTILMRILNDGLSSIKSKCTIRLFENGFSKSDYPFKVHGLLCEDQINKVDSMATVFSCKNNPDSKCLQTVL